VKQCINTLFNKFIYENLTLRVLYIYIIFRNLETNYFFHKMKKVIGLFYMG